MYCIQVSENIISNTKYWFPHRADLEYLSRIMTQKYYSFDVFDTVLSRVTATPEGVFSIIQHRLVSGDTLLEIPEALRDNFARIRVVSEKSAREKTGREEITLREIYEIIGREFSLPEKTVNLLADLEITEEIDAVYGIASTTGRIKQAREAGYTIVFVSDSYLPQKVICQMLIKSGAFKEEDRLFVSSEYNKTKKTGNLFRCVLEALHCKPGELIHVGDNQESDVIVPSRMGILCSHFGESRLSRYEQIILLSENAGQVPLTLELIAGISRKTRLNNPPTEDTRNQILSMIGTSIAGPILLGYVFWILHEAKKAHCESLFFVARDGQVLLEIAQVLREHIAPAITCRYLYGSRQAWHLPSVTGIGDRELSWILEPDPYLTVTAIADRLEIAPDLFCDQLTDAAGHSWSLTARLSPVETQEIGQLLLISSLKDMILDTARSNRNKMLSYLRQENIMDNGPWMMVDLGWKGRLQDSLSQVLGSAGYTQKIIGLYFGLTSNDQHSENAKKAYFFSADSLIRYRVTGGEFILLLEIFTSADHGGTCGYFFDDHKKVWRARLFEDENQAVLVWGLNAYRAGVLGFVRNCAPYLSYFRPEDMSIFRELSCNIMEDLLNRPDRAMAGVIGSFPYSSDQTGSTSNRFAPPLNIGDYIEIYLRKLHLKKNKKFREITHWIKGSVVQSGFLVRFMDIPLSLLLGFIRWSFIRSSGYRHRSSK